MEIAKQELIVQAREAASRVLSALSGACGSGPPSGSGGGQSGAPLNGVRLSPLDRQMSERMASDARKREQFQRLKEQFVKEQEVGGVWAWVGQARRPGLTSAAGVGCRAAPPGGQAGGAGGGLQLCP